MMAHPTCPACGLRMVYDIAQDVCECPDHGVMSGLFLLQLGNVTGWQAASEIKFAQLRMVVGNYFYELRKRVSSGKGMDQPIERWVF